MTVVLVLAIFSLLLLLNEDRAPSEWDAPEWRKWLRNQAQRGGNKWL